MLSRAVDQEHCLHLVERVGRHGQVIVMSCWKIIITITVYLIPISLNNDNREAKFYNVLKNVSTKIMNYNKNRVKRKLMKS